MTKPTHILVLRLSALGDVAMVVPVLRVVTQTYPELTLTVVSRPTYKPIFEGLPNINFIEADVYGKHKGLGLLGLARAGKKAGANAVADLHNVIRSKIITGYLSTMGLKTATIDKGRAEKKALTQASNKKFEPIKTTHQRYADVFASLGYPIDLKQHIFPERKELTPALTAVIGKHFKKIIGVAPFAAFSGKMYPMDLMKKVIATLSTEGAYQVILFGGGEKEKKELDALQDSHENVISMAGRFSLKEELALISNLDVMLSMDSGNGHLAALYGIPTVTLWGVTHPYAGFAPFGQPRANSLCADREQYPLIPTSVYGNKQPQGYEKAMHSISPESIVAKVKDAINFQ